MSVIQTSYQNVRTAYEKFSENRAFRPAQKNLFATLSAMFPSLGLSSVRALKTDVYYHEARHIGQQFGSYPESLRCLQRPAKNYCQIFDEVLELIKESPHEIPLQLTGKLELLGRVHLQFATTFIPEWRRVNRETTAVLCLEYPQTLTLFLGAIFADFAKHKQNILDQDEEIMAMLPNLAIEKLLISGCQQMPELFRPYAAEIYKKGFVYRDLSSQEKENLHRQLIKRKEDEDVPLQPITRELWKSILEVSSLLNRSKTNLIFRVTFEELGKAFPLLETLPEGPFETEQEAATALIRSYLSNPNLSEKDLPQALFAETYRLPIRAMKTNGSEEDVGRVAALIAAEPKAAPWLQLIRDNP